MDQHLMEQAGLQALLGNVCSEDHDVLVTSGGLRKRNGVADRQVDEAARHALDHGRLQRWVVPTDAANVFAQRVL